MAAVNPDADSRETILAAAERLIATRGVKDSSLAGIALEAGISRGTLYWHFRSKDELILAIAGEHMAALTGKFDSLAESEGRDLGELLPELFDEVLADGMRSSLHVHLMHEVFEGSEAVRAGMARSYAEWRAIAARQFERRAFTPAAAADAATLLVAAIDGLILQEKVAGNRDRRAEARVARFLAAAIMSRSKTDRRE